MEPNPTTALVSQGVPSLLRLVDIAGIATLLDPAIPAQIEPATEVLDTQAVSASTLGTTDMLSSGQMRDRLPGQRSVAPNGKLCATSVPSEYMLTSS